MKLMALQLQGAYKMEELSAEKKFSSWRELCDQEKTAEEKIQSLVLIILDIKEEIVLPLGEFDLDRQIKELAYSTKIKESAKLSDIIELQELTKIHKKTCAALNKKSRELHDEFLKNNVIDAAEEIKAHKFGMEEEWKKFSLFMEEIQARYNIEKERELGATPRAIKLKTVGFKDNIKRIEAIESEKSARQQIKERFGEEVYNKQYNTTVKRLKGRHLSEMTAAQQKCLAIIIGFLNKNISTKIYHKKKGAAKIVEKLLEKKPHVSIDLVQFYKDSGLSNGDTRKKERFKNAIKEFGSIYWYIKKDGEMYQEAPAYKAVFNHEGEKANVEIDFHKEFLLMLSENSAVLEYPLWKICESNGVEPTKTLFALYDYISWTHADRDQEGKGFYNFEINKSIAEMKEKLFLKHNSNWRREMDVAFKKAKVMGIIDYEWRNDGLSIKYHPNNFTKNKETLEQRKITSLDEWHLHLETLINQSNATKTAERLGVSRQTIYNLRKRKKTPTEELQKKIIQELNKAPI